MSSRGSSSRRPGYRSGSRRPAGAGRGFVVRNNGYLPHSKEDDLGLTYEGLGAQVADERLRQANAQGLTLTPENSQEVEVDDSIAVKPGVLKTSPIQSTDEQLGSTENFSTHFTSASEAVNKASVASKIKRKIEFKTPAVEVLDREYATKMEGNVIGQVQPKNAGFGISMRLVTFGLMVIWALVMLVPTFNRYVQQQEQLRDARAKVLDLQEQNQELRDQLARWNDPNYVQAQARAQIGYVLPGQTMYVVQDPQTVTGEISAEDALRQKYLRQVVNSTPWYVSLWDSLKTAGESSNDGLTYSKKMNMIDPPAQKR